MHIAAHICVGLHERVHTMYRPHNILIFLTDKAIKDVYCFLQLKIAFYILFIGCQRLIDAMVIITSHVHSLVQETFMKCMKYQAKAELYLRRLQGKSLAPGSGLSCPLCLS